MGIQTSTLVDKTKMLKQAGYRYNSAHEVYYHANAKKVFSVEFIEDHDTRQIEERIRERTSGTNWRYYFNSSPSDPIKRKLESVLA